MSVNIICSFTYSFTANACTIFLRKTEGGFPVIAETTSNQEISQVMLAAMVLALNFYCKDCQ